jgi:hypothetical protein
MLDGVKETIDDVYDCDAVLLYGVVLICSLAVI